MKGQVRMQRPSGSRYALPAVLLICVATCAGAGDFGINVHGFTYHPDREDSLGNKLQGINPGIGWNLVLRETRRTILANEGGIYRNSSGKAAEYVSLGFRVKLFRGLSVGPAFGVFHSSTYNLGEPVFAVLPVISYRYGRVALSAVYFPRYEDINRNAALTFYGTFYLSRKGIEQ